MVFALKSAEDAGLDDRQAGLRRRAVVVRRGHRPGHGPRRLPDAMGSQSSRIRARQRALPRREGRGDDRRGAALPLLPGPGPRRGSTIMEQARRAADARSRPSGIPTASAATCTTGTTAPTRCTRWAARSTGSRGSKAMKKAIARLAAHRRRREGLVGPGRTVGLRRRARLLDRADDPLPRGATSATGRCSARVDRGIAAARQTRR